MQDWLDLFSTKENNRPDPSSSNLSSPYMRDEDKSELDVGQAMPVSLPQEIKEEVIQHLHTNKPALKACALASRALLAPSQKHLFAHILLLPPLNKRGPNARKLKALLSTSPHLGPYVRFLEVFRYHSIADLICDSQEDWLAKDTALAYCLPLLGKLQGLVIDFKTSNFWYESSYEGSVASMVENGLVDALRRVISLPSMVLLDVGGFPFGLLRHCGSGLKHLTLHTLRNVDLGLACPCVESIPKANFALESLSFTAWDRDRAEYAAFEKTRKLFDLSGLKKLSARAHFDAESHRQIWSIIEECSSTLEEFVLVPCDEIGRGAQDPIEWDKLSSLKSLDIRMRFEYHGEAAFLWLLNAVEKISSAPAGSHLESILIQVKRKSKAGGGCDAAFLDNLERLLCKKSRFPVLKSVHLRIVAVHEAVNPEDGPNLAYEAEAVAEELAKNEDRRPHFKVSLLRDRREEFHPGFSPDPSWTKTTYFDLWDRI
ncbi:hypothetical protein CVT26_002933 [Gymnopilus dilepis]|uniref:F-box domain-containing protein n=1 Tax=Gymnopilus dilepis TaxID=231916 RepID=A0A409VQY6_9AGAR|nr:hypothetical protein CVT26_002933 [Gymnopilus dilepis]